MRFLLETLKLFGALIGLDWVIRETDDALYKGINWVLYQLGLRKTPDDTAVNEAETIDDPGLKEDLEKVGVNEATTPLEIIEQHPELAERLTSYIPLMGSYDELDMLLDDICNVDDMPTSIALGCCFSNIDPAFIRRTMADVLAEQVLDNEKVKAEPFSFPWLAVLFSGLGMAGLLTYWLLRRKFGKKKMKPEEFVKVKAETIQKVQSIKTVPNVRQIANQSIPPSRRISPKPVGAPEVVIQNIHRKVRPRFAVR